MQTWNPEQYARNARFVADLGMPVVELLAPKPGERILDLGCGDGALTEKLVACGCEVVGVDASAEQVAAAAARGLDARVMSATELTFDAEFDAVFSNAVLHWVKQADDAIAGVRRALRPGGRFVGEFGGGTNVATIVAALEAEMALRGIDPTPLNPWYYPSAEEYRSKLEKAGFRVRSVELIPRPTRLPGSLADWLETFTKSYLSALPEGDRKSYTHAVEQRLRPSLCNAAGVWTADYVRLRFAADLPK
jgi:trans-aconitate methyltransferase